MQESGGRDRRTALRITGGAGAGLLAGVSALLRARQSIGLDQLLFLALAVAGGTATAAVLEWTRTLRTKTLFPYYLSWMLAATTGCLVMLIPMAVTEEDTFFAFFALFIGPLAGMGLAAFSRWTTRGTDPH